MSRARGSRTKTSQAQDRLSRWIRRADNPRGDGETASVNALDRWWRPASILPILLLAAVAIAAYGNAWPNALVYDDKFYAGSQRYSDFSNIPRYFSENVWAGSGLFGPLYRPLLLTSVTLDARIYGDWVAGYHLTNIGLHALVTLMVFALLLQFLRATRPQSPNIMYAALLASLVFAVHPVNAEAVNSVFNRSELMVAFAAMAGLWWFLRDTVAGKPARAWIVLGVAYLFALFSKESAFVLPGIVVLLLAVLTPGNLMARLHKCLPVLWLLIPLLIYLAFRAAALAPPERAEATARTVGETAQVEPSGAVRESALISMVKKVRVPDAKRLLRVAGLWYRSFKLMLWPKPLSIAHAPITKADGISGLLVTSVLIALALYLLRQSHVAVFFGLMFFYLALVPASRIVGDPSVLPHLAERYLYFPSVGLAVILAGGLHLLSQRLDVRWAVSAVLVLMIALTPLTWARNAEWSGEIRLLESDYLRGNASAPVLVGLSAAYLKAGSFKRAAKICDDHVAEQKEFGKLSINCAVSYSRLRRFEEAERAYLFATTNDAARSKAHANLARMYLDQGRRGEAKKQFELAIKAEKLPANRAWRTGHMLVRLYPRNRAKLLEAKAHFEEALELQPTLAPARLWLERVDRYLGTR